jgi:hypothetical protein
MQLVKKFANVVEIIMEHVKYFYNYKFDIKSIVASIIVLYLTYQYFTA